MSQTTIDGDEPSGLPDERDGEFLIFGVTAFDLFNYWVSTFFGIPVPRKHSSCYDPNC
ncbi:MAG: hypothetical protein JWN03_4638 [Nocardia sp.]|nr:hypothetical protein [Nocardia sp.]